MAPPNSPGGLNKKIGGVATKWWVVGGVITAAGVIYYTRSMSGSSSAAATTATTTDPTIDPSTGVPYADEQYSSLADNYGTYDSGGASYTAYDNEALAAIEAELATLNSQQANGGHHTTKHHHHTTNTEWLHEAIKDAESHGVHNALARTALSSYLIGAPLTDKEVNVVRSTIGRVGPPPQGAPPIHHVPHHPHPKHPHRHHHPKHPKHPTGSHHPNP